MIIDTSRGTEVARFNKRRFNIIKFEEQGKTRKIINYYIIGEKSTIFIINSDRKELDYCESTWEK